MLGNLEPKHHGPTPDELTMAATWCDTLRGRVLSARAFPLTSQCHAEEHASRGELASGVQAFLDFLRLVETGVVPEGSEAIWCTDSDDSVKAYQSQVILQVSITKESKSPLRVHAQSMKRVIDYLAAMYGVVVKAKHVKGQKNRKWDDAERDMIEVRTNVGVDWASRVAARYSPRKECAATPQAAGVVVTP